MYMQSIFSIKDTIGKKETREISALCGITVTQVRDYISSQRSRVRKLVNLSREKATRSEVSTATSDGCSLSPDETLLISKEASNNTVDHITVEECTQVPETSGNLTAACSQVPGDSGSATTVCTQFPANSGNTTIVCSQVIVNSGGNTIPVSTQVPGNMGIVIPCYTQVPVYVTPQYSVDVATVCTQQPVAVSAVQGGQHNPIKTDLNTVEGGPSSSQKEETIPGVDYDDKKFLENIFNLMRKEHTFSGQVKLMEWVLQIHNTAVLSWFSTKGGITILATWLSQAALEEQTTVLLVLFKVLCHLPLHKALPVQMSAILQTVNRLQFYRTSDISNRAKILSSRWSKMFVRSKAPRNTSSRNLPKNGQEIIRKDRISDILGDGSWPSKMDLPDEILAFPGSIDDSRKEEPKRAMKLLESSDGSTKKHGRNVSSANIKERRKVRLMEYPDQKMAGRGVPVARAVPSNQSRPMSSDDIQKAKMRAMYMQDKYGKTEKAEEPKAAAASSSQVPANGGVPQLRTSEVKRPTTKVEIETQINPQQRNSASQEHLLEKLKKDQLQWQAPPAYPEDLESPAAPAAAAAAAADDADVGPPPISSRDNSRAAAAEDSTANTSAAAAAATGRGLPEPDIELLAALLKNPDIVYALTSGQGKNLSNNQKVALLDLVKTTGVGLAGIVNEFASVIKEVPVPVSVPEPTSLPSPTPPASATRVSWRSTELQPQSCITTGPNLASHALPPPPPSTIPMDTIRPTANQMAFNHHQAPSLLVPSRVPTTILSPPQQLTVPANPWPPQLHRLPAPNLQPTVMTTTTTASSYGHAPLWQTPNPPEIILPPGHYRSNHHASPMPSFPPFPPPPMKPQSRALPQTMSYPSKAPAWPPSAGAALAGGQNLVPVSRTGYSNNFINGPVVYPANSNNTNNDYNKNNMYPLRRNEYPNESGTETWGARSRQSSDVRYDQNFSDPRREYGRCQQAEWSRQGYSRRHNIDKRGQNQDRDHNGRR